MEVNDSECALSGIIKGVEIKSIVNTYIIPYTTYKHKFA